MHDAPPPPSLLHTLSRKELQAAAKRAGIKANAKSAELIRQLSDLSETSPPRPPAVTANAEDDDTNVNAADRSSPTSTACAEAPPEESPSSSRKRRCWTMPSPGEAFALPAVEPPPAEPSVPPMTARESPSAVDETRATVDEPQATVDEPEAAVDEPAATSDESEPVTIPSPRPRRASDALADHALAAAASAATDGAAATQSPLPSPTKSPAAAGASSENFFSSIHQRVAVVAASPAAGRDPALRKSLNSLSSTLLDVMLASRSSARSAEPPSARAAAPSRTSPMRMRGVFDNMDAPPTPSDQPSRLPVRKSIAGLGSSAPLRASLHVDLGGSSPRRSSLHPLQSSAPRSHLKSSPIGSPRQAAAARGRSFSASGKAQRKLSVQAARWR